MPSGVALPPGAGKAIQVLGNSWTIKAGSDQTAGAIAVLEGSFRPGSGAPPHVHHRHAESFYVLEGAFRFRLGPQTLTASAGSFVFVPRDLAHGFENVGPEPGTLVGIMTPAGFERLFEEVAQLPPGHPDPARLREILDKYDQEEVP